MLKKILPHFCIILSVVMLVFLITDQVNSAMAFINNQGTKVIMIVFSLLVLLMSILYIADQRKSRGSGFADFLRLRAAAQLPYMAVRSRF